MAVNMENVIRNKRKEKGISQEELAKRCGVSRQTINAIENDKFVIGIPPGPRAGADGG